MGRVSARLPPKSAALMLPAPPSFDLVNTQPLAFAPPHPTPLHLSHRRAQDGQPSPLLPTWLELGLQPVHAQRSKGLRNGASPLLLPGGPWRRGSGGPGAAACSLLEPAAPPPGSAALEQLLPSREVLERSEFLLPLDAETARLYRRLLQA